jgi:hypothetical protein
MRSWLGLALFVFKTVASVIRCVLLLGRGWASPFNQIRVWGPKVVHTRLSSQSQSKKVQEYPHT